MNAQQHAKRYAGQRGMAQRIGKKGHFVIDRHRAEHAEQRRDEQDGHKGIFHKIVIKP